MHSNVTPPVPVNSSLEGSSGSIAPPASAGWTARDRAKTTTLVAAYAIAAIWVMQMMGFTMPKTSEATSWEVLDIIKTGILGFTCLGGAYVAWRASFLPQFWRVATPLIPFGVYFAYALLTVLWSPMKSVSVAQCGGLAALLLLTLALGILCQDRSRVSLILKHLNWGLLASSLVVLIAYAIDPTVSGLNRSRIHSGGDGMIHPTAAGATASLGLLLPVLCHFIGKIRWAKSTLMPCLVIHGCILVLSHSRTAALMAVITTGVVLFWYSTHWQRMKVACLAGLVALGLMMVDPGFTIVEKTLGAGTEFVTRGQTGAEMKGMSGRAELWSAVWQEYQKSLVFGHGYFITSETGELMVWSGTQNYTAHNLILQILVSTGAVGLMIFGLAIFQITATLYDLRRGDVIQRRVFLILAISGLWYLGWAQLGISFMGPVRPESIYFFALLGIGLGQASTLADPQTKEAVPVL